MAAPIAEFSYAPASINVGDIVAFTDESQNSPTSWHWDFGDGNTSTDQNPIHSYQSRGVFVVIFIARNDDGNDSISTTLVVLLNEEHIAETTLKQNLLELIGQGIDFPFAFTTEGKVGTIGSSNAGERISDSIHLILSTRPGERLFNPEFGSRLHELVFEPNDVVLSRLLKVYTVEALRRWEKRIEILNVTTVNTPEDDGNAIGVVIYYRIRNTHIQGSYVFPFVKDPMPSGDLYTGVEMSRFTRHGSIE